MTLLTNHLLVDIVTKLATTRQPLVEAKEIVAYCDRHRIDVQGDRNAKYAAFWAADLEEGAGGHRLQKFKRSPTAQGRNAWCLSSTLVPSRA